MSARVHTQTKPATSTPSFSSVRGGLLQRKCACGGTSGMSGECKACSNQKRLGLQTKLKIGAQGDVYEQEADRIADQVMSKQAYATVGHAPLRIQRFTGQPTGQFDATPASADQVLTSPGRPLEPGLRQDMEQRFGHDFSRVRVHSHAVAEQSAREVNAHAYTVGHNIVFASGQFAPGTHEGRRLLAHELTHVVQQAGCGGASFQRKEKETAGSWLTLATTGEKLSKASLRLYQLEPYEPEKFLGTERALLEIIKPESHISALATRLAVESKVARPMSGPAEKIESPFNNYLDLQDTLRTFETALVSQLREGANVLLDSTETKLRHMYALYVGTGPHLDWLQNVQEGYRQHGPGWLESEIEEVKKDPDVIKLGMGHEEFKSAIDREQRYDDEEARRSPSAGDPRSLAYHYFEERTEERKRKLQKQQQHYNESLIQVLRKKSKLSFLPGFDVAKFLSEKSADILQSKLIGFVEDSGLKVSKARKKLGDRRFLYGADILIDAVKDRLAGSLGEDPKLHRSVAGEDPVLGTLSREMEQSRRVETLDWIIDRLAQERKAESTIWEDIVKVLEVLSTFVPSPIGWGIRAGVAAASFDIKVGRAAEQGLLYGTELSSVAPDPNAALLALGEAAIQVVPDVPLARSPKDARLLTLEKSVGRSTGAKRGSQASVAAESTVRKTEGAMVKAGDDVAKQAIRKEDTVAHADVKIPGSAEKHEIITSRDGFGLCSAPPCPNISLVYKKDLANNKSFQKRFNDIRNTAAKDPNRAARLAAALVEEMEAARDVARAEHNAAQLRKLDDAPTKPGTRKAPKRDRLLTDKDIGSAVDKLETTGSTPEVTGGDSGRYIEEPRIPSKKRGRMDIDAQPGGPDSTVPRLLGETAKQALDRIGAIVGKKISDVPQLAKLWDEARLSILSRNKLTASNYKHLYNLTRDAFWKRVAADTPAGAAARKVLADAGFDVNLGGKTAAKLGGVDKGLRKAESTVSLDHLLEKARDENWKFALDADNLQFEFSAGNTNREVIQSRHPSLRD